MDVYLCGPSSRTAALWSLQLSGRCRCISNICEMEWEVYLQRHSRVGLLFWIYWLLKTQDMIYVIYLLCYIWRSVLSACISYSHLHPEVYLIPLQTYNNCMRRRKTTEFSALFCSFTRSPMYINIHDQFPCWIIHLSLCITHTSSFITETIAIKKFLWWGTQKRG